MHKIYNTWTVLISVIILLVLVIVYVCMKTVGGFDNDYFNQGYEYAKILDKDNRLTFKNLKKGCPKCTNVDYNKYKNMIHTNI